MGRWIRRMRGALGIGLAWGAAWLSAGLVLLLIVGPDAADVPFPLGFGFLGFLAGLAFTGVLAVAERGRGFDELSLPRFTLWGGVGGALLAGTFVLVTDVPVTALAFLGPILAAAGAACAGGSLALARAADGAALEGGAPTRTRIPGDG